VCACSEWQRFSGSGADVRRADCQRDRSPRSDCSAALFHRLPRQVQGKYHLFQLVSPAAHCPRVWTINSKLKALSNIRAESEASPKDVGLDICCSSTWNALRSNHLKTNACTLSVYLYDFGISNIIASLSTMTLTSAFDVCWQSTRCINYLFVYLKAIE